MSFMRLSASSIGFDFLNADDRAEGFFLHELHRMIHVREDRGLEVVALAVHALSAAKELGALLLRISDLRIENFHLRFASERPDVRLVVHRIAHGETFDGFHEMINVGVVDSSVHIDALHGATALARVVERAVCRTFGNGVHIDIFADIDGIFSAKLELGSHQMARGRFGDFHAGAVGAREINAIERLIEKFSADGASADNGDEDDLWELPLHEAGARSLDPSEWRIPKAYKGRRFR